VLPAEQRLSPAEVEQIRSTDDNRAQMALKGASGTRGRRVPRTPRCGAVSSAAGWLRDAGASCAATSRPIWPSAIRERATTQGHLRGRIASPMQMFTCTAGTKANGK
jgi:hypothetical protein